MLSLGSSWKTGDIAVRRYIVVTDTTRIFV